MSLARGLSLGLPFAALVVVTSCASAPPPGDVPARAAPTDHGARDASDADAGIGEHRTGIGDSFPEADASTGEAVDADAGASSSEAPAAAAPVAAAPSPVRTAESMPAKPKERRCPATGVMRLWPPEQRTDANVMARADHAWNGPDFRRCRGIALDDHPTLTGRKVGFYIQRDGSIREVCTPGAKHPSEAYSACIVVALHDEAEGMTKEPRLEEITLPGEWAR